MLLNDKEISSRVGMIEPYESTLVRNGAISYGQSSFGYDLRLSSDVPLKIFKNTASTIDPKHFDAQTQLYVQYPHVDDTGIYYIIPPQTYALGVIKELLRIPSDITALFIGKSTYARCGLIVNTTPGEAGWKGHLTLELFNSASSPIKIYADEGIVQALFFEGNVCSVDYDTRGGKYQNQPHEVITARA
jgi:dCTP deaminase